jgi:hypothetical protein
MPHKNLLQHLPSLLLILTVFEELIISFFVRYLGAGGGAVTVLVGLLSIFLIFFTQSVSPRLLYILTVLFFSLVFTQHPPGLYVYFVPILNIICGLSLAFANHYKYGSIHTILPKLLYAIILISLLLTFISPDFNIYDLIGGTASNRPSGIFSEPSHAYFYVALLYYVATRVDSPNLNLYFFVSLLLFFFLFSAISLLLATCLIVDWLNFRRIFFAKSKLFYIILLVLCISFFFSASFVADYISSRTIGNLDDSNTSLSLRVFLYYWTLLVHSFIGSFLGSGPGALPLIYDQFNLLNQTINPPNLNQNDGSFLFVQLILEYGVPFTIFYLLNYYTRLAKTSLRHYFLPLSLSLAYLLLRGWGASPVFFYILPYFCLHLSSSLGRSSFHA